MVQIVRDNAMRENSFGTIELLKDNLEFHSHKSELIATFFTLFLVFSLNRIGKSVS